MNSSKISLNLTDEANRIVREMATQQGISITEVLRRGVSLERFVLEQLAMGSTFFIQKGDKIERVYFLW